MASDMFSFGIHPMSSQRDILLLLEQDLIRSRSLVVSWSSLRSLLTVYVIILSIVDKEV